MPNQNTEGEHEREDGDSDLPMGRSRRFLSRVRLFDLRDQYWRILDAWEEHRRFRLAVYGLLLGGVMIGATWIWIHPWWSERTAIGMARQWLAAGRLDRASESVQKALSIAPENPVVWQMAAELARLNGNKAMALNYAHYAAEVSQWGDTYVLAWASSAIQADKLDDADKALAYLPAAFLESSSLARRIAGEIARRKGQLNLAQEHFEAALKLDGPMAVDEVPLGIVLVNSAHPAIRQRGLALLEKWAERSDIGASAIRALLADALVHDNAPGMLKWAQALKSHPGCTLGDIPNCLLGLLRSDEKEFKQVLVQMEKAHASDPSQAALLIGWLNRIGQGAEAFRWAHGLPSSLTSPPAVAISMAESLRQTGSWNELQQLVQTVDFGEKLRFMGWAYGMLAARQLKQAERENELWNTLKAHAESNGAHALFAANTIYSWGWSDEGVLLFKIASEVPGVEMQALGALLRHYQVQRDAIGQFEAYRSLRGLRSHDEAIGNNYAFFASLTGRDYPGAERISRDNFEHHPENVTYRATYAFVLATHGSHAEAHRLLRPVSKEWKKSSALAFAYGYILAKTGDKAQARIVLASLDPGTLSKLETELLADALK
ncbi:MAG: hypothetical protein WC378_03735 [Opitutaceae bacterium]